MTLIDFDIGIMIAAIFSMRFPGVFLAGSFASYMQDLTLVARSWTGKPDWELLWKLQKG